MSDTSTTSGTAKTPYAWVVMVACCVLVTGSLGTVGGTSAVFLYPISQDLDVPITTLSIYLSVSALIMAVLGPFAGRLLQKFSPSTVIAAGSAVLAAGAALYGVCQEVWQFYAVSVVVAIGASVVYFIAVPSIIMMWFRERTGFAMSVALAFSGIGSMVMNIIVGAIIKSGGWRTGFFSVGIICAVLTIPVALLLLKTPQQKGLLPYGAPLDGGASTAAKPAQAPARGVTQKQSLKTSAFYIMFIGQFCFSIVTASNQLLNTYGQANLGFDAIQAGVIVSCCAFGLIFGKILLGMVTDKFGVDQANVVGGVITIIGLIMIAMAFDNTGLIYVAAAVFGLGLGVYNIEPPVYVRKTFGMKEYSAIFGGVSLATTLGSSIFIPVYNQMAAGSDYRITFYLSAGFTAIACLLYIVAGKVGKDYVDKFDPAPVS
jgi:MFS family permease